jgi:hypothetical protein
METVVNHYRPPTKYEQERIDAMKPLGCVCCAVLGVPNLEHLELHHILDGGVRMGHWFSIFLCAGHHQGRWTEGQLDWIEPKQRFAISDGRKRFNAVYGNERSLWERVQKKLKLPLVWPVSKRVPRGGSHVENIVAMAQSQLADSPLPSQAAPVAVGDREAQ